MTRSHKYQRCKKCKELVLDAGNCANCANRDPLSLTKRRIRDGGRAPRTTLDQIEGNHEEDFGGVAFAQKVFRA